MSIDKVIGCVVDDREIILLDQLALALEECNLVDRDRNYPDTFFCAAREEVNNPALILRGVRSKLKGGCFVLSTSVQRRFGVD